MEMFKTRTYSVTCLPIRRAAAVGGVDCLIDAVQEPANDLAVRDGVLPAVDE